MHNYFAKNNVGTGLFEILNQDTMRLDKIHEFKFDYLILSKFD